jgi:hypothetical protein
LIWNISEFRRPQKIKIKLEKWYGHGSIGSLNLLERLSNLGGYERT